MLRTAVVRREERALSECFGGDNRCRKKNLSTFDETHAINFVPHDPSNPADIKGREGIKQRYAEIVSAFPDLHYTIEDLVAEGDRVVVRWTASLTHTGEFEGVPPTGNRAVVPGVYFDRRKGGRMGEEWAIGDTLGLLQQLGIIPSPKETGQ